MMIHENKDNKRGKKRNIWLKLKGSSGREDVVIKY